MNAKFLWSTITVKSIDSALPFYRDLLGLTMDRRFSPNPNLELCFLKDENGIEVELLEHKAPEAAGAAHTPSAPVNLSLGFQVENLESMMNACKAQGIEIVNGPFEGGGVKFFFVKDPNGVSVQFVEK